MRKLGRVVLAAVLAFSLCPAMAFADDVSGESAATVPLEPGTYVEHEAIAYVLNDAENSITPYGLLNNDILADSESLMDISPAAAAEALGADAAVADSSDTVQTYALSTTSAANDSYEGGRLVLVRDETKSTEELIAELEADSRVIFAEPNTMIESAEAKANTDVEAAVDETAQMTDAVANALAGTGSNAANNQVSATPQDTSADPVVFGQDKDQPASDMNPFVWGYNNDGHMGGVSSDQAIDTGYTNWKTQTPDTSLEEVVVAVIDDGVDVTNPDLAPVMWSSDAYPTLNTIKGADTYGFSSNADGASYKDLSSNHGTHVAGTIAASWDSTGMSGQASNAEIMALRYGTNLAAMLQCFDYIARAVDAGVNVKVSNNSWTSGQGAWRSVDLAVTQVGQKGVVSIFAAGNSATDNDGALTTVTTLADNPYAVVVNAICANGDPTVFTHYGITTTDVMAPGSEILSTTFASSPQYLGEGDKDAVMYESFDSESRRLDSSKGIVNESALVFDPNEQVNQGKVGISSEGKSFDGDAALNLTYSAVLDAADLVVSDPIDLSGLSEKPTYLSIRYSASDYGNENVRPIVSIYVKSKNDGPNIPLAAIDSFGVGGDGWSGFYAELPQDGNVDWSNFQITIEYELKSFVMTGGYREMTGYADGTVIIDSIGLGSDKVPYTYMQGTSMACPAVAGVTAVLAGTRQATVAGDAAKSAEKLASLVQAAAKRHDNYIGVCSTSGYATVSGASDPGPVITAVKDNGDDVLVTGYFMSASTFMYLNNEVAQVTEYVDLGDQKGQVRVAKPDDFAGGQVTVEALSVENGKRSRHSADLGQRTDAVYYDQMNLAVPDELDAWGSWQLVGFNGQIYCLPRCSALDITTSRDYMLRYDPKSGWSKIAFPEDIVERADLTDFVVDVSAVTYDGALLVQMTDTLDSGKAVFLRYDAAGAWTLLDFSYVQKDTTCWGTLANDGKNVYVFGGISASGDDNNAIYRIDFKQGTLIQVGQMKQARIRPQVAYANGTFAVSGGFALASQQGGVQGAELVTIKDDQVSSATVDFSSLVTETGQLSYAPAAVSGGFMFAGPTNDFGTVDTYTVKLGETVADAYTKRASEQMLLTPAATAYQGTLYVLAATQNAPYRVFSATAVETEVQPGDVLVTPGPGPSVDPTTEVVDFKGSGGTQGSSLAKTGDNLALPIAVVIALGALACAGVASIARRRIRTKVSRINDC